MNFLTHAHNTHAQLCVHATLLLHVRTLPMPAAYLLLHRIASHSDTTLQLPRHSQFCLSVYKIAVYRR